MCLVICIAFQIKNISNNSFLGMHMHNLLRINSSTYPFFREAFLSALGKDPYNPHIISNFNFLLQDSHYMAKHTDWDVFDETQNEESKKAVKFSEEYCDQLNIH
mmetsp:Transcript_3092/g.4481  ORF Transcript_3092/g.4481 Transcript_3092/m.4481 type:complete len:104 (-) Transcript_3092:1933-2244(-)